MKIRSIKFPKQLEDQLLRRAADSGRTPSSLVREAVQEYLAKDGSKDRVSFATAAADLAGCVTLDANLSTNKKHLSQYGR